MLKLLLGPVIVGVYYAELVLYMSTSLLFNITIIHQLKSLPHRHIL